MGDSQYSGPLVQEHADGTGRCRFDRLASPKSASSGFHRASKNHCGVVGDYCDASVAAPVSHGSVRVPFTFLDSTANDCKVAVVNTAALMGGMVAVYDSI